MGNRTLGLVGLYSLATAPLAGQQADTATADTLPPITVSVTRADLPLARTPLAVHSVTRADIARARPTWGLDEALAGVPGVYVANRYNFSLDQRVSIRGFGSRSAFAVRGIKILVDGIPQTLPDGQGQLTNVELGLVDRIDVLRGSASALFGNASGGVISVWTDPSVGGAGRWSQEARVVAGSFDRDLARTWIKWQSTTRGRLGRGAGNALVGVSRLVYEGERDHSGADLRGLNTRVQLPVSDAWSLAIVADVGDQPRADNPGALTLDELRLDRDAAAPLNLSRRAGKDVLQAQAGMTLRRRSDHGTEGALTLFGLRRDLENPQTFAYIDLDRLAYGARLVVTGPVPVAALAHRLTAGIDFQRQRDDRLNFGNTAGQPDGTRLLDQLEHVTEVGPFVQSTLEPGARTTITTGLRYDRVRFRVRDRLVDAENPDDSGERRMSALSGALGVAVHAWDAITLYGNVASSFETPTTTELANRPDSVGGFNADLGPQRAWSYEVGARGVADRLGFSVAVFRSDVQGLITSFEIPTFPGRRFFRNAGAARHAGLELSAHAGLARGVSLTGTWTYSDFRYTDFVVPVAAGGTVVLDGRSLPGIPRHWLRLLLKKQPRPGGGLGVEVEQVQSSGYLVDDTASVRVRPWAATHFRAGWEGSAGGWRLSPFVGLSNAFDKHYVGSVVINGARGRYYEPAPGRHAYLGVEMRASR